MVLLAPGRWKAYRCLAAERSGPISFRRASTRTGLNHGDTLGLSGRGAMTMGDEVFADLFAAGHAGTFAEYVSAPERAFQPMPPAVAGDPRSGLDAAPAVGRTYEG